MLKHRVGTAIAAVVLILLFASAGAAWYVTRALAPAREALQPGWLPVVHVLAGDGVAGARDGVAARARFSDPFGVAVAGDGTLYVADAGESQAIRRMAPNGDVTTMAGGQRGFTDGIGATAAFDTPSGIALAPDGTLIVADTGNDAIRRVTPDGVVTTVARAGLRGPIGVAVDVHGRVFVADTYHDRIVTFDREGHTALVAGSGVRGWRDGVAEEAQFDTPSGIAVDRAGVVFVADTGNGVIRRIADGIVTTVDPVPALVRPVAIAVSGDDLYVSDDRGRVVELAHHSLGEGGSTVRSRMLAGSTTGFAEGTGADARLGGPGGLAVVAPGRLVFTDPQNALVRSISAATQIDPVLPVSPFVRPAFDLNAFALTPILWPADPMVGPHEITGTLGEARGESGGERFHAGLDVQAPQGALVRAIRDGVVTSPLAATNYGTLNESLRVGPLTYIHQRVGRTRGGDVFADRRFVPSYDEQGRLSSVRVRRGARFATGEAMGTVNAFNHVHLNVGWPGQEINPLALRLIGFTDTIAPTIPRNGVRLFTLDGQPVTSRQKGRLVVSEPVQIVVDAWDQADGNLRHRRLAPYELGYQVIAGDNDVPGFERPRMTIRFDRLAPDPAAASTVYATGSGIPFYGTRTTHFLYVVTNTLRDGVATKGQWDPSPLTAGDYTVRVYVRDISGNETVGDLAVSVVR